MPGGGDPSFPASNSTDQLRFHLAHVPATAPTKPSGWTVINVRLRIRARNMPTPARNRDVGRRQLHGVPDFFGLARPIVHGLGLCHDAGLQSVDGHGLCRIANRVFQRQRRPIDTWSQPYDDVLLGRAARAGGPLSGSVGNQGWTHFWTTAVAPANTTSSEGLCRHALERQPGGGAAYFDDVTFGPAVAGASKLAAGNVVQRRRITIGPTNLVTTGRQFHTKACGTLDIQLGSAPAAGISGCLTANNANLAGTLKADLLYGYSPGNTDNFIPITFNSESGGFGNFTLPSGTGCQFAGTVTFTNVVLSAYPSHGPDRQRQHHRQPGRRSGRCAGHQRAV